MMLMLMMMLWHWCHQWFQCQQQCLDTNARNDTKIPLLAMCTIRLTPQWYCDGDTGNVMAATAAMILVQMLATMLWCWLPAMVLWHWSLQSHHNTSNDTVMLMTAMMPWYYCQQWGFLMLATVMAMIITATITSMQAVMPCCWYHTATMILTLVTTPWCWHWQQNCNDTIIIPMPAMIPSCH